MVRATLRYRVEKIFEIETKSAIKNLFSALRVRKAAYAELSKRFAFLKLLTEPESKMALVQRAERLVENYRNNLEPAFAAEVVQFSEFLKSCACQDKTAFKIMKLLHERKLINVFPNLSIALQIYLSIPVSNCEREQSFSKLALIKKLPSFQHFGREAEFSRFYVHCK